MDSFPHPLDSLTPDTQKGVFWTHLSAASDSIAPIQWAAFWVLLNQHHLCRPLELLGTRIQWCTTSQAGVEEACFWKLSSCLCRLMIWRCEMNVSPVWWKTHMTCPAHSQPPPCHHCWPGCLAFISVSSPLSQSKTINMSWKLVLPDYCFFFNPG